MQYREPLIVGRYAVHAEVASGGMATVHLGRLLGSAGFSRTVAIKRLHTHYAKDASFVSMFLDEARLASRIQQANVVPVLDMHAEDGELLLVMEYVQGESLVRLRRAATSRGEAVPLEITSAIMVGTLSGLHAAHEAKNEAGEPLGIVHRDVSPQNVLVGADGVARLIDFGIAKATGRLQETRQGTLKGKLPYMAPEQILSQPIDRRTDVYSAAMVLWFMITGELPFTGPEASMLYDVLHRPVAPPSKHAHIPPALDALVMRGLSREPKHRFSSALEMAEELQRIVTPAPALEVAAWVERLAGDALRARASKVAAMEASQGAAPLRPLPPSGPDAAEGDSASEEAAAVASTTAIRRSRGAKWAVAFAGAAVIAVPIALLAAGRQQAPATPTVEAPPASAATAIEEAPVVAPVADRPDLEPLPSTEPSSAPKTRASSAPRAPARATATAAPEKAAKTSPAPPLPADAKYGF